MSFSCWRYNRYNSLKKTWIASKLFYYGQKFQQFGSITLEGTIADCVHNASDGDCVFDLNVSGTDEHVHCELTPCQDSTLHAIIDELKVGQRIRVTGTRTLDPPHHIGWKKFAGGGNEIHPVTNIEVL